MRKARPKVVGRNCWSHLCNRLAGPIDEYPLTDVDKEFGFKLINDLSRFFYQPTNTPE